MGGDVKDFQIKIVTTADLNAAKASAQELTNVATATKASAAAASEDGKAAEALTQKTGFLNLKKTELKKLVRELGQEFPIAGQAGRMMMNPIIASLSLGIMAFGAMKKKLDEWDATLEASAKQNASKDFLPGIEAKKEALDQATASAAEFAVALGNIGRAEDKFKTSVSQAIDKLHEFMNAQAEVNSAGEAKELAEVDLKQKTGKLDEVGAIKQREAIKARYRKTQDDLKTKSEQDEIKLQETELEHDKQPSLVQAEEAARKKRDTIKARQAQAKKDLETGETKSKEYEAAVAKAQEEADAIEKREEEGGYQIGFEGKGLNAVTQAKEKLAEAQRMKAAQDRFNARNKRLIKDTDEGPLPKAEGEFSVAESRAKTNAERINELDRTLPGKREVVGIRKQGRETAGGLKDRTTAIETAGQIAQELKQGQEKAAELNRQILSAARSGGPVTAEVLKAFQAQEALNNKVAAELAEQSCCFGERA
jgi:hypothetical protein